MGVLVLISPNQEIPKVQAIVALANGLNLTSGSALDIASTYYTDARAIPTLLMQQQQHEPMLSSTIRI